MISDLKKSPATRIIWLVLLAIGLLCIIIALVMKLTEYHKEEKIPIEQLLQQHWQQQLTIVDSVEATSADRKPLISIESAEQAIEAQATGIPVEEAVEELAAFSEKAEHELEAIEEHKIDINTATALQLQQLKGIGPSKAEAIIADRELKGKFKRIEDIKRVKGIGEKLYEGIKESIVASP